MSNKVVVVLLIFSILLSIISLTVTLSINTQPLKEDIANPRIGEEETNSGQVRLEVLANNKSKENENETE